MGNKLKITCFCESELEIEVPESVDLSEDDALEERILSGAFLSFRCGQCGKILKPELPLSVRDSSRGMELFLVPELERGAYFMGKTSYAVSDAVHGRIVIGYPELVEKLKIARSGLDDRVVELIKYLLGQKTDGSDTIQILFHEGDAERLTFHILGLKEGEVGVSKVPRSFYERMEGELEARSADEPYRSIVEPPYVSINKMIIEVGE
ncbi:MAG TPA: CpXC domain-containing protein [Spirochaetia bacterium]|nr:CpXC domain-containing protein [Spirochaetia bacterium]